MVLAELKIKRKIIIIVLDGQKEHCEGGTCLFDSISIISLGTLAYALIVFRIVSSP